MGLSVKRSSPPILCLVLRLALAARRDERWGRVGRGQRAVGSGQFACSGFVLTALEPFYAC